MFNGFDAKRSLEMTLAPHNYKVFVEGSGEALFTKRASPVNAYEFFKWLLSLIWPAKPEPKEKEMGNVSRQVYIISDIHMGGDPKVESNGGSVDFRIFTHTDKLAEFINNLPGLKVDRSNVELVINGDFIDFLAEGYPNPKEWEPYWSPGDVAEKIFKKIAESEKPVFEALKGLLAQGAKVTVLVGNHDMEFCWPQVRKAFADELGVQEGDKFNIIYDKDSYRIDTAVIEHGNKYDFWNNTFPRPATCGEYDPCRGSELVAEVMNPKKLEYSFINLLKPELKAAVPILAVIDPDALDEIDDIWAIIKGEHEEDTTPQEALRAMKAPRAQESQPKTTKDDALNTMLEDLVDKEFKEEPKEELEKTRGMEKSGEQKAKEFIDFIERSRELPESATRSLKTKVEPGTLRGVRGEDDGHVEAIKSWFSNLIHNASAPFKAKYPIFFFILRDLQNEDFFKTSVETEKDYRNAAIENFDDSTDYFILGHSHIPKDVTDLAAEKRYLNTGAWANMIRIPKNIWNKAPKEAYPEFDQFMNNLENNNIDDLLDFDPSHVRMDLDENDKIGHVELVSKYK